MTRPAGLILDYGHVLTHPQDQRWMEEAAARLGARSVAFRDAYWRHRHEYDAGLPVGDYWRRVLAESRASGEGTLSGVDLAWVIDQDLGSWAVYREEMWSLAAEFRGSGGRLAFLSNSGPEMMARVRAERPLATAFDVVVISYEVGLSKPDPRIYRLCLERLGVAAPETLLVDDRVDNIEGAVSVGLRTLHFEGAGALDRLRALLG